VEFSYNRVSATRTFYPFYRVHAQVGPQGAAVTLKNNVIVTDALQKRLEVFTAGGASLSRWGLGKFYNPCAVAVSPNGNCVVTDTADHSV